MNFTQNPIKTIVLDDNMLTRSGIKSLLSEDREIKLVCETDACKDLIALTRQYNPDVMLISSNLLLIHCSDYLETLASSFPCLKIIVLATSTDISYTTQASHPGLTGHLIKDMKRNELAVAIKIVYNGGIYYSKEITDTILKGEGSTTKQGNAAIPKFSDTEKSVLELCCKGLITKEIASILQLAPKTIEHYKERMILKTGSKNATSLAVYALLNNIIRREQLIILFFSFLFSNILDIPIEETVCILV